MDKQIKLNHKIYYKLVRFIKLIKNKKCSFVIENIVWPKDLMHLLLDYNLALFFDGPGLLHNSSSLSLQKKITQWPIREGPVYDFLNFYFLFFIGYGNSWFMHMSTWISICYSWLFWKGLNILLTWHLLNSQFVQMNFIIACKHPSYWNAYENLELQFFQTLLAMQFKTENNCFSVYKTKLF